MLLYTTTGNLSGFSSDEATRVGFVIALNFFK